MNPLGLPLILTPFLPCCRQLPTSLLPQKQLFHHRPFPLWHTIAPAATLLHPSILKGADVQEVKGEDRDEISNKTDTLVWWMACLHPDVGCWSRYLHSDPIIEHQLCCCDSLLGGKKRGGKILLKKGQNITWQGEVEKVSAVKSPVNTTISHLNVQTPHNAASYLQNSQDSKQAQSHRPLDTHPTSLSQMTRVSTASDHLCKGHEGKMDAKSAGYPHNKRYESNNSVHKDGEWRLRPGWNNAQSAGGTAQRLVARVCSTKQQQKEWTKRCCKRKTCSKGGQMCCQGSKRCPGKAEASMPCLWSTCATREGKGWTKNPPISSHPNCTLLPSQLQGITFRPGETIHPSCPVVQSHRRVQAPVSSLKEALGIPCLCSSASACWHPTVQGWEHVKAVFQFLLRCEQTAEEEVRLKQQSPIL